MSGNCLFYVQDKLVKRSAIGITALQVRDSAYVCPILVFFDNDRKLLLCHMRYMHLLIIKRFH